MVYNRFWESTKPLNSITLANQGVEIDDCQNCQFVYRIVGWALSLIVPKTELWPCAVDQSIAHTHRVRFLLEWRHVSWLTKSLYRLMILSTIYRSSSDVTISYLCITNDHFENHPACFIACSSHWQMDGCVFFFVVANFNW